MEIITAALKPEFQTGNPPHIDVKPTVPIVVEFLAPAPEIVGDDARLKEWQKSDWSWPTDSRLGVAVPPADIQAIYPVKGENWVGERQTIEQYLKNNGISLDASNDIIQQLIITNNQHS